MARLELERGTDVLLLETGDALLLELEPGIATPLTIALILTTYIPTITISGNIKVIPGTLALSLTTYIPTITASDNIEVIPSTLALSLTTYIPLIDAGLTARPGTLTLTLTTYTPGVGGVTGDIVVKIAFVSDALDASPTWVDVTSDVLTMYIKRGRQHELDRFEAGTATIVLDNQSSDYWPDNGSSPYSGDIKLRKRLYIAKLSSGIVYDLYTGFIDDWKPGWRGIGGKGPTMTLKCSDLIKIMSRMPMNTGGESEELSGARIGNILDTVGWADRTLDTGKELMRATGTIANEKAQAHIQAVCKSEISNFFIAPSGYAVYEDRSHRAYSPHDTSQATFGNDKGAGELPFIDIEFSMDDKLLINEARGTCVDGTEQTATDATSITNHGLSGVNDSGLLLVDDIPVDIRGLYLIARFADVAGMRVKSLTFLPQADPINLWPKALGYDISTRITVNLDQASLSRDYFIEGIEHRWKASENRWTTKWQLSEASRYLFPTFPARDQDISPDASGDETNINFKTEATNWESVVVDGVGTYVANTDNENTFDRDLYNFEAPAYQQGTINKITVTGDFLADPNAKTVQGAVKLAIKSGSTVGESGQTVVRIAFPYETVTYDWPLNPDTGNPWTWAEIVSIQAGPSIKRATPFAGSDNWTRCKYIKLTINFTPTWA